jgi:dolichyl-phosphate-mannose--protein O-mannosyl transferase
VTSSRSFSFLFYFLPAVPFLCVALALVAQRTWGSVTGRAGTAVVAVAAISAFVFFLPILSFRPLTPDAWRARIWFTDCPPGTLEGVPPSDPEPAGWCWA